MKQSNFPVQQNYSDSEFENYYKNLEQEQLSLAEVQGKQDGLANKPDTIKYYNIHFLKPLASKIQKALDFNFARFQPVSDVAVIQSQRASAVKKVDRLIRERNDKEKKVSLLRAERQSLRARLRNSLSSKLSWGIPIAFGVCEGFLVANMLSSTSLPGTVCLMWGLLTALVATFGVRLSANFICRAKSDFLAKIRWGIVLLLAFWVALALGLWRANIYSELSAIDSQINLNEVPVKSKGYSPWPFVIVSFVSFLVALAFEIKYWMNDEDKKRLKTYEDKGVEIKETELEKEQLEKQISQVESNSVYDSALVMRKQEYAAGNEQRLLSLAREVVGRYESTNIDFRGDNQTPGFFDQQSYFNFKLYFTKFFNVINQNS